jgi:predicted RNA-binding Zn-ribbon protein involved in translation (DUF1610 family)
MQRTSDNKRLHPSLTAKRVLAAVDREMSGLDNPGFCISCGNEQEDCEPDARQYQCEECGKNSVYGAEELLISFVLH